MYTLFTWSIHGIICSVCDISNHPLQPTEHTRSRLFGAQVDVVNVTSVKKSYSSKWASMNCFSSRLIATFVIVSLQFTYQLTFLQCYTIFIFSYWVSIPLLVNFTSTYNHSSDGLYLVYHDVIQDINMSNCLEINIYMTKYLTIIYK